MKVPNYIREAIMARMRAADKFLKYDCIVTDYLEKHGIECEYKGGYVGTILESGSAAISTIDAIANKEEN